LLDKHAAPATGRAADSCCKGVKDEALGHLDDGGREILVASADDVPRDHFHWEHGKPFLKQS
jgi:hypothetical protein